MTMTIDQDCIPGQRRPLSTAEAAAALGIAPATIRDWKRQGLVQPKRRNAWDLAELRVVMQAPKVRRRHPARPATLLSTPKAAELLGTTKPRFLAAMAATGVVPSAGSARRPLWDRHTITSAWALRPADLSYNAAHRRIYKVRGKASEYVCSFCHITPATEWAYRVGDATEAWSEAQPGGGTLVYSTNPDDYDPACSPCHEYVDTRRSAMAR